MNIFQSSSIYYAMYGIDRLYFAVTSRTARTLCCVLLGIEKDYCKYVPKTIKCLKSTVQKVTLHKDKDTDEEYGYCTYFPENNDEKRILLEANNVIKSKREFNSFRERLLTTN